MKYKINNIYYDYDILYKHEDIRKDKIILNIIKLIDLILKKEENLDLNILTYGVRPINSKCGLIEFIPDCKTIYDINQKMKFSILNYIIENNKEETIDVVRNRFMRSSAAYCVITYLLGIGDRHLENIMITKKGILFHIDYSFILGFDAKNITPHMRITSDMVDALGGENSEYYEEFKKLCNIIFNCLRRHINLFINMLTLLADINPTIYNKKEFTKDIIKKEILKRFIPGENNEEAELQLYYYINTSNNNYKHIISDYFHYHYQENNISNALITGYDEAKNVLYNIYSKLFL
jgi:phosphatidylinositol 3-kinase